MNLFLIPIWKRQPITEVCLHNLQYFNQQILCIVSRTDDAEMCYRLKVPYCWFPNEQLGAKWNHGLFVARPMKWDYIITLGSDDIVKESLFDFYESQGNEDILIMDKIHFIDIATGRATLTSRARVGAGRRISRNVIEAVNYKLWTPERNRSLDMDSSGHMNRAGFACVEKHTDPHIIGLKSETNIWSFDHLMQRGAMATIDQALKGVPQHTIDSIFELLPESVKKPKFVTN